MPEDVYKTQRLRVERMIEGLAPGGALKFDESSNRIRFRVERGGVSLIPYSGEWEPAELAKKPDQWLRALLAHLSDGKIR